MSITLMVFIWAVIALVILIRKQSPKIEELNTNLNRVLSETVPALEQTNRAIEEAHRALSETADTIQNLHMLSDNLRHKVEVADSIAGKVRKLPEQTARLLGGLLGSALKGGGRLVANKFQDVVEHRNAVKSGNHHPEPSVESHRTTQKSIDSEGGGTEDEQ